MSRRTSPSSEIVSRTGRECTGAPGGGAWAWPVKSTSAWSRRGARSLVSLTLRPGLLPWCTSPWRIFCGSTLGISASAAKAKVALTITVMRSSPR
ncbi:hypothetical protein BE18_29100 [Sorangium cellulosum]|uniref:Uncharacterized protein n=1 Tax=Sorangium cellulosum TaxID=56 RepID=A0A150SKH9_SORCE|nr:hypothetical protein BE18_29100 [Sorangium cellulosum]